MVTSKFCGDITPDTNNWWGRFEVKFKGQGHWEWKCVISAHLLHQKWISLCLNQKHNALQFILPDADLHCFWDKTFTFSGFVTSGFIVVNPLTTVQTVAVIQASNYFVVIIMHYCKWCRHVWNDEV